MFLKILQSHFLGYLEIKIEGYYIERFINICKKEELIIWNIKKIEGVNLIFRCSINDYKKIVQIAKKIRCKTKIKNKKGIPFFLHKYKKRKIFLIFLLIILILMGLSTMFVWNVEIEEKTGQELENIEEDLAELGLETGKMKKDIDTNKIISGIRLKRNDIAWIGIEIKGTNAIVDIVKAQEKPEIIDEDDYCNIVSEKDGVITKINVQEGTANVNIGDTIKNGDTLVNGWMEGKYTGIRYVHATADIEAKVWYTKKINVPYNYTEKKETGEVENQYSIKFNNFQINFHKGVSKFEFYDTMTSEKKMQLFSDFYFPISIVKKTNTEITEEEKTYQKQEAINFGISELEKQFEEEIEDKESIVNKNVNIYENTDSIDIQITYEVIENIGTNEKILF